MIERYTRPRMGAVWSERNKYDRWLEVELTVCEAWTEEGTIPLSDMEKLRGCTYDYERLEEILAVHRHEMTAFLQSITEHTGPEGRWLHLGLTTSDVWDTATSLQILDAIELLDDEIDALMEAIKGRALEHKDTLMIGRTHGIHAEPVTFGLKLAVWYDEMRRNKERLSQARARIAFGKLSGPVGTHGTVPPSIEAAVCERLGLKAAPASTQILQRDRHAEYVTTLALIAASLEKFATEIRGAAADGDSRGGGVVSQRTTGVVVDAAQAEPGAFGAGLRAGAADSRLRPDGAGERGVVARAGHKPFVGGAADSAGRIDSAGLCVEPDDGAGEGPERGLGAYDVQYRVDARGPVFAESIAGAY